MGIVDIPKSDLSIGESKTRTPAYASFDSNTDKLLNLFKFRTRGVQNFYDELKTTVEPQIATFCAQLASVGKQQSSNEANGLGTDREAPEGESTVSTSDQTARIVSEVSKILLKPMQQVTEGLLAFNQWIPVLLVTTVEAYLKDVRVFESKVNPAIMESSDQSVTYREVVRSRSIDDLAEEMQSRWARNFVDDGGPARWIDKLTKMGARTYDSQTADKMETLWGVRHVIVHSAGVATPDLVRRHLGLGATVGKNIAIRLDQLLDWIRVVHHFVDVTDFYFAQRYKSECAAFGKQLEKNGDTL